MIALSTTSIAWVLVALIIVGYLVYYVLNDHAARPELGSEVEMAPNRKPYFDDDTLEGPRLTRVLGMGVVLLLIIVVALPLYWIFEPSRQAGAQENQEHLFVEWGLELFQPTADGGFNCAGCHGGMNAGGGEAAYTVTDPATGEATAVNWKAPALNTIFYRYDDSEVKFILTYGRPFSPMSPWGTDGGGPMNDQQLDTLIAYLHSIQLPREECGEGEDDPMTCPSGHLPVSETDKIDVAARKAVEDGDADSYGEALFNLELNSGAYSCARCHTQGWSWGDPGEPGQGAFGWNLTGGSVDKHFPNESDMIDFVASGSTNGAKYGVQGQGSGRMPGFGSTLTEEQIQAIVEYVRSL